MTGPLAPPPLDPALAEALACHGQIVRELGPPEPGVAGERLNFERARAWWNEGGPAVRSREDVVPIGSRGVRVAIYEPEAPSTMARPAYLYLHGGGYRLGSPRSNDRQLRELAHAWGGIVVSCDYAHIPEKRFPAAVEETALVFRWLSEHGASWGIDGGRLAIGGSSAGANVALGAIHASTLLRADPAALPPLFLAAAAIDAFRDSSVQLARHVAAAGRPVELAVYEGMTHTFFGYSRMVPTARRCIADLADFLHRQLPSGATRPGALP
jgi:acetyl esterase